jgi:hypothetical protein
VFGFFIAKKLQFFISEWACQTESYNQGNETLGFYYLATMVPHIVLTSRMPFVVVNSNDNADCCPASDVADPRRFTSLHHARWPN